MSDTLTHLVDWRMSACGTRARVLYSPGEVTTHYIDRVARSLDPRMRYVRECVRTETECVREYAVREDEL